MLKSSTTHNKAIFMRRDDGRYYCDTLRDKGREKLSVDFLLPVNIRFHLNFRPLLLLGECAPFFFKFRLYNETILNSDMQPTSKGGDLHQQQGQRKNGHWVDRRFPDGENDMIWDDDSESDENSEDLWWYRCEMKVTDSEKLWCLVHTGTQTTIVVRVAVSGIYYPHFSDLSQPRQLALFTRHCHSNCGFCNNPVIIHAYAKKKSFNCYMLS